MDLDEKLIWASRRGYLEIARLLLQKGAKVNRLSDNILHWGICSGKFELVKLLLEHKTSVDDMSLRLAEVYGYPEIAEFLKSHMK